MKESADYLFEVFQSVHTRQKVGSAGVALPFQLFCGRSESGEEEIRRN